MRFITIVTGILFVLTAMWCFANSGATFLSLAFVLGSVMIFQGVMALLAYLSVRKRMQHGRYVYMVIEGILAILLGIIVLANQLATEVMVPVFFGMWILFVGVMRIAIALHMEKGEDKTWIWMLALGIVSALAGIYAFFNPILAGVAIVVIIAITFLLQGINIIAAGIEMPRKNKGRSQLYMKVKDVKDEFQALKRQ